MGKQDAITHTMIPKLAQVYSLTQVVTTGSKIT